MSLGRQSVVRHDAFGILKGLPCRRAPDESAFGTPRLTNITFKHKHAIGNGSRHAPMERLSVCANRQTIKAGNPIKGTVHPGAVAVSNDSWRVPWRQGAGTHA